MKRATELGIQRSVSNIDFATDCLGDILQVILPQVPDEENEEVKLGDLQHFVDSLTVVQFGDSQIYLAAVSFL